MTKENWTVAVLLFSGTGLNMEHLQFRSDIPLALIEEIKRIPTHRFTEKERKAWEELLKQEELRRLQSRLGRLLRERDTLFLENGDASLLVTKEKSIALVREELEEVRTGVFRENEEALEKPVLLSDLNMGGELHEYPDIGLVPWARTEGYNCLIWGEIEALEQLLYIEIKLMYTSTEEVVTLHRGTFFGSEQSEPVNKAVPRLRSLIYGKKWADIVLELEPPVPALFNLDGRRVVPDRTGRVRNIPPGEHTLTVRRDGYFDSVLTFNIEAGEIKKLSMKMNKKNPSTVKIGSFPAGAEVFIDSEYAGNTPLLLRDIVLPSTAVVLKKGYHEVMEVLEEDQNVFQFHLHPEEIDIDGIIENSRQRFYRGLAGFLISLPLTIVTYGKSTQYAYAYNSAVTTGTGSIDETERLQTKSTLWYTAYLGSLFLNSVLFTDTLLSMVEYIRSSQE